MIGIDDIRTDLSSEGADEGGNSRVKRLSQVIVRNNTNGVYQTPVPFFDVINPNARLRCIFAVGFRPDGGNPDASNLTGWAWTVDAWGKFGEQGGFWLPMNNVVPGPAALPQTLPSSYEATTGVKKFRVTLSIPNLPGTNSPAGNVWAMASWEPVSGAIIGDGELQGMFRQCTIDVNAVTVSELGV